MLSDILNLLGLSASDTTAVAQLTVIISTVSQRLCMLLEAFEVPAELSYIVTEVSVARYNRIGSEGLSSHSVEGETLSFIDDDFGPYMDDINAYLTSQDRATKGVVRFL